MTRILWILFFTGCAFISRAQERKNNVYAVVIGISNYENKNIRQLVYSHKDAQLFAQWLQSSSGGNVPVSNIRVLLNEQATIAAIYNALDWLKQQCKEGDEVYIYFSGHGDIETADQNNKGYLLAYNTPPNNYPNNAVSVEQLNTDANFLTLQKKVRVVLITDACHSGKLAGDFFKGKQWVAQQLQQVLHEEIRLAACAAHEEAAEGEFWGGGRGVFSYYLLKGLYGWADALKDGVITFKELQVYIDSSFKTDEYLQLLKHKQAPVTDGNPALVMAAVDSTAVTRFQQQQQVNTPGPLPPVDYFFKQAAHYSLENFIDFKKLPLLNEHSFPLHIINTCIQWQNTLDTTPRELDETEFIDFANSDSLLLLKQQLIHDVSLQKKFTQLFVELVHNQVQSMINAYLAGEEAELEKRQYYYSGKRNYGAVLRLLETALSLIPSNHHLAGVLQTNKHYLSGVLARMEMAVSKKTDSLLKTAFFHLYKTLELEPYAAYVHNELANLYVHQKKFDSAQYHFDMASALASTWAIPWSNQIRMNLMLKNYAKATMALHKADSLQPNLSYVYMNAGLLMEREHKLLDAQSYFLRAAKLNPVHYLPFERLGNLYLQTGDYLKANSFFFKAATLKNSFSINDGYFLWGVELGGIPPISLFATIDSCFRKTFSKTYQQHALWLLLHTLAAQDTMHPDTVIRNFHRVLQLDSTLPLVHHYLGKVLVARGKNQDAAVFLREAIRRHKADSLLVSGTNYQTNNQELITCIYKMLTGYNYAAEEDFYLLARSFEQQQRYKDALSVYEEVSLLENTKLREQAVFKNYTYNAEYLLSYEELLSLYENPVQTPAAVQQMKLYEQLQQYEQAEAVLLNQVKQCRTAGDLRRKAMQEQVPGTWEKHGMTINFFWVKANRDLEITVHDFYTRMMRLQPRNFYWKQQAARFLYDRLQLAYSQMPQDYYASFTNSLQQYAYPWASSDEPNEPQTAQWPLPGLNDTIIIQIPVFHPVNTALSWLQEAEALSPQQETGSTTAGMYGNLYNWLGNEPEAKRWFEYVLQKQPADTVTRRKLVEVLLYAGYHTEAKKQLDTLDLRHYTNLTDLPHLIFLHTASGNWGRAEVLLQKWSPTTMLDSCRKMLQRAQLLLQQNQFSHTIRLLQTFPERMPAGLSYEDSTELRFLQSLRYYVTARCYAFLKQEANAVLFLKQALEKGFCLVQVLKNDAAWSSIRKKGYRHLFQLETDDSGCTGEEGRQLFVNPISYRIPGEADNF